MRRWLVLLVFTLLLPGQAYASAARLLVMAGHDAPHALTHLAGEAHHHHDDGSMHVDDSAESSRHLHADCAAHSPALATSVVRIEPPAVVVVVPPRYGASPPPPPFLEEPGRPPRPVAGPN